MSSMSRNMLSSLGNSRMGSVATTICKAMLSPFYSSETWSWFAQWCTGSGRARLWTQPWLDSSLWWFPFTMLLLQSYGWHEWLTMGSSIRPRKEQAPGQQTDLGLNSHLPFNQLSASFTISRNLRFPFLKNVAHNVTYFRGLLGEWNKILEGEGFVSDSTIYSYKQKTD